MTTYDNPLREADVRTYRILQNKVFNRKADIPDVHHPPRYPDGEQIQRICNGVFGESPSRIELMQRSTLHAVFRFQVRNQFYIARCNLYPHVWKEVSFFSEQWAKKQLYLNRLGKSQCLYVDISRDLVPFDYEISEAASGISLHDRVAGQKAPRKYFVSFGRHVAKVHSIRLAQFGPLDISALVRHNVGKGIYSRWWQYLCTNLSAHVDACQTAGLLTASDAEKIHAYSNFFESNVPVFRPVLLHGDVANHNALVHRGRIELVDWEDCLSGDPVYDIAYMGTGCFGNTSWFDAFLEGYQSITSFPGDFHRRFGYYFLRICLAKAIIRLRFGIDRPGTESFSGRRIRYALSFIGKVPYNGRRKHQYFPDIK